MTLGHLPFAYMIITKIDDRVEPLRFNYHKRRRRYDKKNIQYTTKTTRTSRQDTRERKTCTRNQNETSSEKILNSLYTVRCWLFVVCCTFHPMIICCFFSSFFQFVSSSLISSFRFRGVARNELHFFVTSIQPIGVDVAISKHYDSLNIFVFNFFCFYFKTK